MEFDVLNRNTHILGSHFLEASAGTGKTFTIEHLVIRLLLQEESPLELSQILIVTFTRAATRELKARLKSALKNALFSLEKEAPPFDYLQEVLEERKESAIRKLKNALFSFSDAQIFTIHGFCQRMLVESAFEANTPLSLEEETEEHTEIARKSVKAFLRQHVLEKHYSTLQLSKVIRKFRYDMQGLEDKLVSLVLQDQEIAGGLSFEDSLKQAKHYFQKAKRTSEAFARDFERLQASYKEMKGEEIEAQKHLIKALLDGKELTKEDFETLLKHSKFFVENIEEKKRKVKAAREPLEDPLFFQEMKEQFFPLIRAAKDPTQILLRLAKDSKKFYEKAMEEREVFSPDRLLYRMKEALKNPLFVQEVQKRYQAVIIDEFQDTDAVQWEIFKTLFLHQVVAFVLVGDPKQAIYAFRNADVYTYFSALEALGKEHQKTLGTNFRSTPKLIEGLNALFALGALPMPKLNTHLSILPVRAGKKEKDGGVHFFLYREEPSPRVKRWPSEEIEEKYFFPFMASQILAKQKPYDQFAILVKDRYQGKRCLEFLKKAKIPAHLKRKGSLVGTQAFEIMKDLVQALLFPKDVAKVKKMLSSPCTGWTSLDLQLPITSLEFVHAKQLLFSLKMLYEQEGFLVFFNAFLKSTFGKDKAIDPELKGELGQIAKIIAEEEVKGVKGFSLLFFLSQAKPHEERWQIQEKNLGNAVQIMTIHMSKGLEFDTVFAYGIVARFSSPDEILSERTVRVFDEEDESCQKALAESNAEKLRQLYVAMTRAKTDLYVPFLVSALPSKEVASPLELFFTEEKLKNCSSIDITELKSPLPLPEAPPIIIGAEPAPSLLKLPFQRERIVSFTTLTQDHPLPLEHKSVGAGISLDTLPLGKETGIFLHHLLEKIFQKKIHQKEEKIQALIAQETAHTPFVPWQDVLVHEIPKLFKLSFPGGFSLDDIHPEDFFEEMEFAYPHTQGLVKGVIDLAFCSQGKYYLLDWKSNYLENYTEHSMHKEIERHQYALQASLYKEALDRYVKLFDNLEFGGVFYIFIRGKSYVTLFP